MRRLILACATSSFRRLHDWLTGLIGRDPVRVLAQSIELYELTESLDDDLALALRTMGVEFGHHPAGLGGGLRPDGPLARPPAPGGSAGRQRARAGAGLPRAAGAYRAAPLSARGRPAGLGSRGRTFCCAATRSSPAPAPSTRCWTRSPPAKPRAWSG
ncbi:MAG: hypothetical protein V9H69_04515 [Anaerolineae bacterium]